MHKLLLRGLPLSLALAFLLLFGCAGSQAEMASSPSYGGSQADILAESAPLHRGAQPIAQSTSRQRSQQRSAPSPPPTGAPASSEESIDRGESPGTEPPQEERARHQLLIYNGSIILAIYDVPSTQERAIAVVEAAGGYISQRSNDRLVLRVPAADFRQILDEVAALGDVLNLSWTAADVTDEVRDLDIRLKNALELRNRLERHLAQAETVEEILKVETELERITLEIERIRGQLISFEDRIAYSTIEVHFRARRTHAVPDDQFLLPFTWLNQLGLQSLLRQPSEYRR